MDIAQFKEILIHNKYDNSLIIEPSKILNIAHSDNYIVLDFVSNINEDSTFLTLTNSKDLCIYIVYMDSNNVRRKDLFFENIKPIDSFSIFTIAGKVNNTYRVIYKII